MSNHVLSDVLSDREVQLIISLSRGVNWDSACDEADVPVSYCCRAQAKSRLLGKIHQSDITGLRLWASPITNKELDRLTGRTRQFSLAVEV